MSFLTINGIAIPVDSATESIAQIYGDTRGATGHARRHRHATLKRTWSIKTPLIPMEDATAFAGMIAARGDRYAFDDATLYSEKGQLGAIAIAAASTPAFIANSAAADGSFNPEAPPFSAYSIYGATGKANVLTTNDATYETSNPLVVANGAGGTLTYDTTHFHQGTKSVKYVDSTGVVNRGIASATLTGFTASTVSVFSVMVYNGSGRSIAMTLEARSSAAAVLSSAIVTIPNGGWYRVAVKFTMPAAGSFAWALYQHVTSGPITIWADSGMLEYNTVPSPWVAPGVTNVGPTVAITNANFQLPGLAPAVTSNSEFFGGEMSIGVWTQLSGLLDTTQRFLFNLRKQGGNPQITAYTSAGSLGMTLTSDNGVALGTISAAITNPNLVDVWHYLLFNLRTSPRKGSYWAEIFVDGVRIASLPASTALPAEPPTLNKLHSLQMQFANASAWGGQTNEFQINPYTIPEAMVAQLYAIQPTTRPVLPRVLINGDMVGASQVQASGSHVSIAPLQNIGYDGPGAGLQTLATLSFTLDEL